MSKKEQQSKIRLAIEMDIDAGEHPNITEEEVKNAVVLRDSDAVDGFEITTDDSRFDNTSDFFLKNGRIVEKELLTGDGNLQLTEKRKTELLQGFVGWFLDHQTSDEGLFRDLHIEVGMTQEEIELYGIDLSHEFDSVYCRGTDNAEIDYKHEVIASVEQEFKAYEADLLSRTVEEVYAHSYESMAKTEFYVALCDGWNFDDKVYKALYQERGKILEELHQDFIESPEASVNSSGGTIFFIKDYCNRYHREIMNEKDEEVVQEDESPVPVMGG